MPQVIFVAPTRTGVGVTTVSMGLCRAFERHGLRVNFCQPIALPEAPGSKQINSVTIIANSMTLAPPEPISHRQVTSLITESKLNELMEEVVAVYQQAATDSEIVIIEGLVPGDSFLPAEQLNAAMVKSLTAQVVLVAAPSSHSCEAFNGELEITAQQFGGIDQDHVLGVVLNKIQAPSAPNLFANGHHAPEDDAAKLDATAIVEQCAVFKNPDFQLLGAIPWQASLNALRTIDVADYLGAKVISQGEMNLRRVHQFAICARTIPNVCDALTANSLLVTSGDRNDILVAAAMAVNNDVPLAGIVFTGDYALDARVLELCEPALKSGLPLLAVSYNTFACAEKLAKITTDVRLDDVERIDEVMDYAAGFIDLSRFMQIFALPSQRRLSPPAFRYQLMQAARADKKRIILPEGEEPRIVEAAIICQEKGLANCALLGRREEVERVANSLNLALPVDLTIIDPKLVRHHYIAPLVERRKHKGVTDVMAVEYLRDNVVLGTMMVAQGEYDGLVAGALGSTANTIRPALQLIKCKADTTLVSSLFFMCLPEQVLVYADCAVNPNPSAAELAEIAIQSADSAAQFGIEPRVAMISYSTGSSGHGVDVEKVKEATELARQQRPDLLIDGPLQYDTATNATVAKLKMPESDVAGKATVYVFPDLNTGNTTYKAVQRSADVISIGPMLQGLQKPVNDLSRGALVQDIIFTIVITAIQGQR